MSGRKFAAIALPCAAGAVLIGIAVYSGLHQSNNAIPKVVVGGDDVYYTHAATAAEARTLGEALQHTGFFSGTGAGVLLSKGSAGTIVSFVLNEGAWDHAATVFSFEEIGRRVASSVGGFPIEVRLCDVKWGVHKQVAVGRVAAGSHDEVYYYASATAAQAEGLGRALQGAGYFIDSGASVVLSKDGVTSIGFVLGNGAWNDARTIAGFEALVRQVAPSVGGAPVDLHLLSPEMEIEKNIPGVR